MATLNNASGGPINYLDVAYVLSEYRTDFTPTEARMGHRIYYSTNGAAGSWTAFGNVNIAAKTTNNIALTFTNLGWANNSPLYIVWLDEDGTSQDGLFGLDDISFTAHPSSPVLALATNSPPSFTALALTIAPVNAPVPVGVVGTPVSNLVVNVTDVDSGGVTGIAIIAIDETHGTFYFSTNNGTGWSLVGSVSGGSARLVATAQGRIYFKPAPGFTGNITNALTFRAWDLSSGVNGGLGNASVNGGNTAYSAAMDAANQTVNPVNIVPSFTKGADQNVAEDAGAQTVPGWATAISAGAISESNQVVNFIVANNNNSLFSIQPAVSATGILTYTPATNVSGSALVSVQIHDDGGTTPGVDTSAAQTFLITVTPVNDAPVLGLPSSAFALAWGSSGSGNGQFSSPWSVAVDGGGNVYVGELGNSRVQKFDSSGNYITKWGSSGSGNGQFSSPYGVAVDGSGNVYVAEYGNNRIQKFTSSGIYLTKWGTSGSGNGQFSSPWSVAVDGSGNVYVAELGNNRIQKFDSSGNYITK